MGDQLNQYDDCFARTFLFGGHSLNLDDNSMPWILNHIDCFDRHARLNKSIQEVHFHGYSGDCQGNEVLDKLGQAIGNLQSLEKLSILRDACDFSASDFEVLRRILSHVRQKIEVDMTEIRYWDAERSRCFARAIHGHPTITSFEGGKDFPYESLDVLYSALATLPALKSIDLRLAAPDDESDVAHPESLTELLRVPSLRYVSFDHFNFTPALCQATANTLMEGTAITKLQFKSCSFSALECAVLIANGLKRNTSVSHFKGVSLRDQALFDVLATALPSNSTLQRLELLWLQSAYDYNLSPFFLALGKNTGLKNLSLNGFISIDESLCTAMIDGLGMSTTLESLELSLVRLTNDNYDLWSRALSFLRTNKVLKSLTVTIDKNETESLAAAFRSDIVAALEENVSLESLRIRDYNEIEAEDFVALITTLLHNTTLKSIGFQHDERLLRLTDDEDKQMTVLLRKNYALESLPDINQGGDVGAILRLNEAGRRYLVQDGSSVAKGVEVLASVSNEINCVFLHLLENPRLCDRNAVETESLEGSNGSANPANHNGKREQKTRHSKMGRNR
jgi:hypothetical protein